MLELEYPHGIYFWATKRFEKLIKGITDYNLMH